MIRSDVCVLLLGLVANRSHVPSPTHPKRRPAMPHRLFLRAHTAIVLFATIFLGACGGGSDSTTAPPTNGAIAFKIDAATCATLGTVTVQYFIDGSSVGAGNLTPGQQSQPFSVAAGPHVTLVKIANSTFGWNNANMTVIAGQTLTRILAC
jgi:hypothetical protein